MMKLASCVIAVTGFIGTSAFAEDVAVGATPAPPSDNVKRDLSAALASVTGSASNFTTRGFSVPARVYPRRLFMGGDPKISYWSNGFGGLADGQVNWTLRAGLNYHFH
jgi:hypothetical protein